jgi:hypothetical protein
MAVNLAEKYSQQIADKFTHSSFVQGNVYTGYEFAGAKTVNIYTPITVDLSDYNRNASANRFGTPAEMQDSVQALELTQDKSFSLAVDKGNNQDQMGVKAGARMLNMQIKEKAVPLMDMWALGKFDAMAGTRAAVAGLAKDTVTEELFKGAAALDNALVPSDNRVCYVKSSVYNMLRLSPEFVGVDKLGEAALAQGVVGYAADMKVVKVPDAYMAAHFICTHKNAVIAPIKIKTARILNDAPGIDGVLLEGRYYFDAYVIGAKAGGVYAAVDGGTIVAAPAVAVSGTKRTVTAVGGVTFYYTTDGSDPRYNKAAKVYSADVTLNAGEIFKCAGQNAAGVWSEVTTK